MSARILIADDSPLALKSVRTLLESQLNGWKVCAEAANGAEALEKALATKPDLIIMDFQMPNMDGLRTSARIVKFLPNVPILMNTNHKSSFLDAEAQKIGVREVIMKSDSGQLLRAVKESLGKFSPAGPKKNEAST
jgi:DNA-binding NarL/FixJ family response regulator